MVMAKLSFVAGAPSIDLAEAGFCNDMLESALNCVDLFTDVPEALNQLWQLRWVNVPQSELAVRIIFTKGVDESLVADEKAEVMAAGDLLYKGLVTERHSYWNTQLDAILNSRPSKCLSLIRACEVEVTTGSDVSDFDPGLR